MKTLKLACICAIFVYIYSIQLASAETSTEASKRPSTTRSITIIDFLINLTELEADNPPSLFSFDYKPFYERNVAIKLGVLKQLKSYLLSGEAESVADALDIFQSYEWTQPSQERTNPEAAHTLALNTVSLPSVLHDYKTIVHITPAGGFIRISAGGRKTIDANVRGRTRGAVTRYKYEYPTRTYSFDGSEVGTVVVENGSIVKRDLRKHHGITGERYMANLESPRRESWLRFATRHGEFIPDDNFIDWALDMESSEIEEPSIVPEMLADAVESYEEDRPKIAGILVAGVGK